MTAARRTGVALVGCGNIAGPYAADLAGYPDIELCGVWDRHPERAEALAAAHGTHAYRSYAHLLEDYRVAIVVNLTGHAAHHEMTARALRAGRHVHSEKPLALTSAEARHLVELAETHRVRLSCAPANFLGDAALTVERQILDGRLGTVRMIYAEANWGRIESWHPSPEGFYRVGPLWDVGVYPLTLAVALFGPVRRVTAQGAVLHPDRFRADGSAFRVEAHDWITAVVDLDSGARMRLTASFYTPQHSRQRGMEFHGDAGSLYLSDWQRFDADVEHAEADGPVRAVPPLREPVFPGIEWGRAVRLLAQDIREDRPHRTSGERAAHLVAVLEAIDESCRLRQPVEPEPAGWSTPAETVSARGV
ncbi:Gfo/Idh/MocA family protein [Streptomyces sp. NPDC003456]|uniref:Gfo/Idh/MocA family protein n=1 Tax=Streptomyces sp. NPDC003456 TaxID=3364683 RepID=UPI0036C017B9